MSKKKVNKSKWGGARFGTGPKPNPTGPTKTKKCVSVNKRIWQSALNLWRREMSPLVETLLSDYVKNGGSNTKAEAV